MTNKNVKLLATGAVVLIAAVIVVVKYWYYLTNPWTRDGQVHAQVIQIAPRISGAIVNLPIVDNQRVSTGDLLFEIDPRTFELAVEQAEAKLQQAKASAIVALDQADRGRDLHRRDKGAISEQSLVRKENKLLQAEADVEVAKSNLNKARLDLEFTEVRAPVDGYVTQSRNIDWPVSNEEFKRQIRQEKAQHTARHSKKKGFEYRIKRYSAVVCSQCRSHCELARPPLHAHKH